MIPDCKGEGQCQVCGRRRHGPAISSVKGFRAIVSGACSLSHIDTLTFAFKVQGLRFRV